MFGLFKTKPTNVPEALTNQTIGGQSVLYRIFRETLGCDTSGIRRLELTYFAATITTYVYLRYGKQPNREGILDEFSIQILRSCIPSSGEKITFDESLNEYQQRYVEYSALLELIFKPKESSSGNPAATLLMHLFELVTQSSPLNHMLQISMASSLIHVYVLDQIDFVKKKL